MSVATLLATLSRHPLVADAAVVPRAAEDGREFRVAYVVPTSGTDAARVRAVVAALASVDRDGPPVLVSAVTAIPRDERGEPDQAGLALLPVPESVVAHPVLLPAPEPGRRHLADLVELPPQWAAGPVAAPADTPDSAAGPPARCWGAEPRFLDGDPETLVDALYASARSFPDRGIHLERDGQTTLLSYPALLHGARRVLTGLRDAGITPGDAAILHTPSLAEHFVALWACMLGGIRPLAVAQSATYDSRTAVLDKLENAWLDLDRPVVLAGGGTVAGLRGYGARAGWTGLRVLDLAECAAADPAAETHRPDPADVAALQLSSGSTGKSKVIQMTHHGLVRYAQGARQDSRMDTGDVFVNWLPLDHVGALILSHLGPIVLGCDQVHVPTAQVLADPLLWLDLLHRYRAQHSWSPNFGYGLVADALAARGGRDWDLSSVRSLISSGEQNTEPVLRRFLDAVRPFGVEEHTLLLAWGMAETCTVIAYQPFGPIAVQHVRQSAPGGALELLPTAEPGSTTFLSVGRPAPGSQWRVTGPDSQTELPELHIGRLQGRSERMTPGYLNNPEANAEAFPGGGWFDTGDLAYIVDGRVTITSRAKEIIIITGTHYYCHEIEDVVGALDGVAQSFVAAFAVPGPDGVERLGVVFVPSAGADLGTTVGAVRARLHERLGLASVLLVAVDQDSFDKTTSGKIQRTAMRGRLLSGGLDQQLRAVELAEAGPRTVADAVHSPEWTARVPTGRRAPGRVLLLTNDHALGAALPGAVVEDPRGQWRDSLAGADVVVSTVDSEAFELVTALAAEGWTGELVTVSRGRYVITGSEPSGYAGALAEAVGEVFALERPGVRAWHLDLPGDERDAQALAEALTWAHREPVLAWRGVPLVRGLRQVDLGPGTSVVEPGSCWLVTGGLGGIGRAILPGLGLRLLVVGRGPGSDVDELGEDVRYARLDVADSAALEAAVAEAERAWGTGLTGVLHLAGVSERATITETTAARWQELTRAKVAGSLAVAEVLRRRPGSRLVAFSSLLSTFPAVGTGAYVAGNRFLEALCEHLGREFPVHCLVWGSWRGTNTHDEAALRGQILTFSPTEGRALMAAALRQPPGTLLLGTHPAGPRAQAMLPARPLEGATEPVRDLFGVVVPTAPPRPVVRERAPGPGNVSRTVRDTLRQVLPSGIPADTPFYEAGLGSLELVRLHTLLQDALGREFPLTTLFAHGTEAALTRHLASAAEERSTTARRGERRDRRIAIIGMAARFPGADTLDDYWRNLLAGEVSTRRSTRDDLIADGLPASLVDDPDFVPVTGALADIAGFDAALFGISPAEATLMDPQQRLFLQICHEALEHGGYARAPGRVGVYAGSGMNLYSLRTYLRERLGDTDAGDQLSALQVAIGNEPDFLPSRVSYRLGLTGPAVSVKSACSTSLVAIHTAVTALLAGDADMALAGAAALHVPRLAGYRYQEGSILSRRGECRAFDADADGTVGGNGVAAVLLKPLEAALADGDTVHAVILGSAINNDGSAKVGYTAPGLVGQVSVIRDALAAADLDPAAVGYVEAHGTGTALGDPIEVEALREVFGSRTEPVLIGSVKANIGHLDSCAGMAGVIKAVLALRHATVPPQPNLRTPSPALRLGDGPIEVPTSARAWPVAGVRRAGVTALGVGGTNAHVILEQAPDTTRPAEEPAPWVVPLSARDETALAELADQLATVVESGTTSPADVLTTLGVGRRRYPHRLVAWGDDTAEALRAGGSLAGVAVNPGPVVFAFSGQGTNLTGAARALMAHPAAASVLRRCAEQHRDTWGTDLLGPLLADEYGWTTATGQPALLALHLAQVALLDHLGVRPDLVIGHSAGEYAALCVAGALSPEDAMHLAGVRGAVLQGVAEGALLAVFDEIDAPAGLELAVRNAAGQTVFGGPAEAVDAAVEVLTARGVDCRRVPGDRAFHTSMVEPALDELDRQAARVEWRPTRLPVVTGLGGALLPPGTVLGAEHVRAHTRAVVDYRAGVDRLVAGGASTFVEVGPPGPLSALGRQWPGTTWLPVLRRGADSVVPGLAGLFCHGVDVEWGALHPGRRVPLPTYPFQLVRYWAEPAAVKGSAMAGGEVTEGTVLLRDVVLRKVREVTAHYLGDKPDRIGPDVAFVELGADSLLMVNMVRELQTAFGVRVAMRELFGDADTPDKVTGVIVERMSVEQRAALVPTEAAPPAVTTASPAPAAQSAPSAQPAQPQLPVPPPAQVSGAGHEAILRDQLDLMERFALIMSDQVALLAGTPAHTPTPPPVEPTPAVPAAQVHTGQPPVEVQAPLDERQRAHVADLARRYTERTARSWDIARRHQRADDEYPIVARRARGAHLEDIDGNTYVDIALGFGALLFGHEPAFVTDAVNAHLADGVRLGSGVEDAWQAAELLRELTGHDKVTFTADAETSAFRLARDRTGRQEVVTFDGANLDVIRARAGELAAVRVEAVPGSRVDLIRTLRQLCDQHGVVLIIDEVLSGFRAHLQGAQGIFGVRADLAIYGGVLGGGYPISAVGGRADIMAAAIDDGSHPVSLVAAKSVLTWLRDQGTTLQSKLTERTTDLLRTLDEFFRVEAFPVSTRQFGSRFRFTHDGLDPLYRHLALEGVHVGRQRDFFLSTAHTDQDLDFIANAVRNSLYDLRRGGFLPGGRVPRTAPRVALPRVPVTVTAPLAEPEAVEVAATTPAFSLYFFGDYPHDATGDKYAAILAAARYADRAGMHAVWLPERHFDSFGGVFPNPSVLAAAIAAQTERVRIHSGSVVLPLHDPIRVAEEWSVVDNLSGGRVSLGVACGWHARDFVLAPQVYGRHREAMYEGVETIRALWRGEPISRTAGNGEPVDVRLYPRPVQGEVDFYTAIVGNPDSYRQAGAGGFGVITNLMAQSVDELATNIALYRETRAAHGLDPATGRVVVLLHTYLGEDTARIRAEAFRPFCDYLRSSLALFSQLTNSLGFSIDLENTPADDLDFLLSRAYDRYCADRALIGSPADVEPIARALAALGVDEIACFVDFGLPPARVTAGLPGIGALRSAFLAPTAPPAAPVIPALPLPAVAVAPAVPAVVAREQEIQEMTIAERQIWYLEQAFPNRPTHNETLVVLLDGDLDVAALRAALAAVVGRHPSLRAVFSEVDGEPRRIVAPTRQVDLPVVDDLGADPAEAANRIAAVETGRAFDLATGPLFEPWLVRLGPHRHLLVLRMHHLVIDTWSAGILSTEIAACYRAALAGAKPELPEPSARRSTSPVPSDSLAYWTDLLADAPAELALPTDRPRRAQPSGRGATTGVDLGVATTAAVRDLARQVRATPFMVVLAGLVLALRKLSGQTDIVVGTPIAHRPEGTEQTVGFFVHTLPLRLRAPNGDTFADLVREVREQVLGAQDHRAVPLPEIVRALGGSSDPLRNPLFDVVVRINGDAPFELDLPGVVATLQEAAIDRAPVDLALLLTTRGDSIRGKLNYAVDLFDARTAEHVVATLREVLTAGIAAPDRVLGDLVALTDAEARDIAAWQDGGARVSRPSLLHSGLSEVDGVAVVDRAGELSRSALFSKAAAVTAALESVAAGPVGVYLPRGGDAAVALVGVTRSGRAFVPLDPAQPVGRIAIMLAEAEVTAVVTHSTLADAVPGELPVVLIDDLPDDLPEALASEVVARVPEDVAYVLFTSGSTGVPKGCVVEHRAITNTLDWLCRDLGITAADRLCWFSSPGFDASAIEVWPALRTGATLYVVPPELRLDPAGLRDWLVRTGITVAFVPTPVCELLLDLEWPTPALRHLLTGGDRLRRRPAESLPFAVWNVYGPTEASVVSTWTRVSPHGDGPPTIGRPVPGTWVRVLDAQGGQVPAGVAGELYLGGEQLARCYVSAEETAARFVNHPEHGRLYRTGDVVRWRFDGELEFLHRNDSQVQIRGYRVEPGEVEHQLRALPGVRDAAVRVFGTALAAYVVTDSATVDSLRAELGTRLPDYMVPATWMVLPALPLNANGKLDRAALPEFTGGAVTTPVTALERRLREVWCAELGVESASVTATFFELGGHSLTAIRMVNRLRAEFGPVLGVLDFLRTPTIRGLADRLTPKHEVERTARASLGQLHGYRLMRTSDTPSVLTIAMRFALRGAVDAAALEAALTALVLRHPALRTRYRYEAEELWQEVLVPQPVSLPVVAISPAALDATVTEWAARPFDLDGAPAFRPVLFTVSAQESELLLAVHHSFSDGWSMAIIITELGELYRAELTGTGASLTGLTADYLDFTRWERSYLDSARTQEQIAGWVAQVRAAGAGPLLLPVDRPRAERLTGVGESVTAALPPGLVERVNAAAVDAGTTPFAVLLAAFAALGHELTGAAVIAPHSSAANRPEAAFEDVVGVFTHTSWLVVPVAGARSFHDLVIRATEALWQRLDLQSVPAAVLNEALGGPFRGTPPRVLFGLYNSPLPDLDLTGVAPAHPEDVTFPVARAEQGWALAPTADGGLLLYVEYSTDLFDADTVTGWTARFVDLLERGLAAPDAQTWNSHSQ
ncbi:non-ribosomal peptide synthetase/type I polyketide synthase [Actinokineospora diospyrosa]|uniref:Amino acid adenylation domain-containing protein/natural product biosynthesis luciferase-like monooxygenase domain-containing protein n=1 Tax=Actinokineospora diospyrosa TaxID=103728 RepID=A0ABT1IBX7_9PSEU|nr:MupA/Atu3671 family FMN-dependent luciferase-like monooxygenase [Actinokineospora diospyrosa]MCP2270137.1 amino acid adenylation domain-containing protein/natural product biosynthesis luciferase-like monooxygenase domain-containing protein [Actinokineospora diospyrosa]